MPLGEWQKNGNRSCDHFWNSSAYLRKTQSIEELIPWLYLKGISTGDFAEALQSLVGERANGFSANVVVRLKEQWSGEYEQWSKRDLSSKQYVYVWADGIHAKIRLEDDANKKQCLLVLMGATADGQKELTAALEITKKRDGLQSRLGLEQLLDIVPNFGKGINVSSVLQWRFSMRGERRIIAMGTSGFIIHASHPGRSGE